MDDTPSGWGIVPSEAAGAVESLALLCPTPEETDLLRACVCADDSARAGWTRWLQAVGDFEPAVRSNRSSIKSLLPTLHHGMRRSGASTTTDISAVLHSAALAERRRYDAYRAIAARAFSALAHGGVPFLVLRGAALAVSAYPDPTLRHSHDVDLLIESSARARAIAQLRDAGFVAAAQPLTLGTVVMQDASGLPVALHNRLYRMAYYTPPVEQIRLRAQPVNVGGVSVLTLAPADHLVHVCGHASCCASRDGLKWVVDAWYLIARHPDLDWDLLLTTTHETRLTVPLAVLLRYLATELDAAIPTAVLDRLEGAARTADRVAREIALAGLRTGTRGRLRKLAAATATWRGRLDLLRWMLLPAPGSLREGEPLQYPRAWPAYYVTRPLGYLARRARYLFR